MKKSRDVLDSARLSGYDLVVFLNHDWETSFQKSRQQFLIAELARQIEGRSRILGVERPICPWAGFFRNRAKLVRALRGKRRLRRAAPNLYICTPVVLVHNLIAARLPALTALNRGLLALTCRRILNKLGFRSKALIAWIHHPYQLEDIGLVGEQALVYDCYDNYAGSESDLVRRRNLVERERRVLERADWVFTSSEELLASKKELLAGKQETAAHAHLVPNGVEYEHFARAFQENGSHRAGGVAGVRERRVLGFTGKITARLDFQLLAQLASRRPEWDLTMIGPQEIDPQVTQQPAYRAFIAAPNVRLLGPRPYRELPEYMQSFDVCILPYAVDNPFNQGCSPLKLYEYLATGLPVVSTDLPAVRPFDGLVGIGRDPVEFERQVDIALTEIDPDRPRQRLAAAQENSWERRAEQVVHLLDQALAQRGQVGDQEPKRSIL